MEIESLLQNEEFIRMVNEDPMKANGLINDLIRENPDKEESIRLAAQLLRYYQGEQLDINQEKITLMWENILQKSKAKKQTHLFKIAPVWKIAASVAILLSLTFCFFEYTHTSSMRRYADEKVEVSGEARIILSDGSAHKLKSNDSHIRYNRDGKEIVIEEKDDQSEKLQNQIEEVKSVFNQIVVPYGVRHSVTLSDGTIVMLNSGSKLVFPAKFSKTNREVFLKGEGYFEVAKNLAKPFIVKTDFINVKVLGTHFNISAYENEKSISAVLIEGSIELYNNNLFNNKHYIIKPGEGCFYSGNDSEFRIQNVDVNEYVSWKDGFLQLKDQPMENVTKKLERYYNRLISIEDSELAHRIISGKLVLSPQFEETTLFLAKTTKSRCLQKEDGTYRFSK